MEDEIKIFRWKISLSRRVSLSIKIAIVFIIFLSLLSLFNFGLSYFQAISLLNRRLGEELLAIVKNSSDDFPAEDIKLLSSLINEEEIDNTREIKFQEITKKLYLIRKINSLDSVYLIIRKGNFGYVIASASNNILLGSLIPLDKFSLSAFSGEITYDRGIFFKSEKKSAYAPIRNNEGEIVGVLGIESSWERASEEILNIRNRVVIFFLASILISLVASVLVAQSITGPVRLLLSGIQRITKGDLSYQVKIKNLWILPWRDEIGELAIAFNKMTKSLQEKNEENRILYEEIAQFNRELENKIKDATSSLEEINKRLLEKETQRDEELKLAIQIQKTLLPHNFKDRGVEVIAEFTPAAELGGDFYNFSLIDPEHLGIVIGDVAGRGVPAALLMAMTLGILHETSRVTISPSEILSKANTTIRSHIEIDFPNFVSAFYGVLNLKTKVFTYAKAGHEIPILYRKENNICEFLDAEGLFLGAFSEGNYQEKSIQLKKGDKIVFFTDGLIEAKNKEGEMFDLSRLQEEICNNTEKEIGELIEKIYKSVLSFVGEHSLSDDFALLVMEIKDEEVKYENI